MVVRVAILAVLVVKHRFLAVLRLLRRVRADFYDRHAAKAG